MFDWDRAFVKTSANEKVFILNKNYLEYDFDFYPTLNINADDKDPPWFRKSTKKSRLREKRCL